MATTTTTTSSAATATPSTSSRSSRTVLRIMQSLVLLVVLIGAIIAIAWLVLNPRAPTFWLNSLSLSGLPNTSDTSCPPLKLHVGIKLTATNPNKKLVVVIQDVNLWLALVHHRCQLPLSSHNHISSSEHHISKRGRGVLTFQVETGPRPCCRTRRKRPFQFTVCEELRKGLAVMSVRMQVSVKFMHAYWPSKRKLVEVKCEDLSIGLSSSRRIGELKDGGKDCPVHFA
ncbi:hypothetical protein ACJRO7_003509 [Eucalyptus globulus]|uniref:Late embryogenesis abundant protein LEA-2 subgroup domain-containing protein n=1 Tax=Eucalyptus globulus TaxID=34317 RepID=A0ABD3IWG8_EUCGL